MNFNNTASYIPLTKNEKNKKIKKSRKNHGEKTTEKIKHSLKTPPSRLECTSSNNSYQNNRSLVTHIKIIGWPHSYYVKGYFRGLYYANNFSLKTYITCLH